jgi:hypothetical protein
MVWSQRENRRPRTRLPRALGCRRVNRYRRLTARSHRLGVRGLALRSRFSNSPTCPFAAASGPSRRKRTGRVTAAEGRGSRGVDRSGAAMEQAHAADASPPHLRREQITCLSGIVHNRSPRHVQTTHGYLRHGDQPGDGSVTGGVARAGYACQGRLSPDVSAELQEVVQAGPDTRRDLAVCGPTQPGRVPPAYSADVP